MSDDTEADAPGAAPDPPADLPPLTPPELTPPSLLARARALVIDITPLRTNRQFRLLWNYWTRCNSSKSHSLG